MSNNYTFILKNGLCFINGKLLKTDLGILKHSVPNYIKNNSELMNKIKFVDFDEEDKNNKGSFIIILKKK